MPQRRSSATRSLVWLRDSSTPMFVVNAQRRVTLFNQGCELQSGWQAADVLGKRVEAVSVGESQTVEALLAALAAPADVWQGTPCQVQIPWPHREHAPVPRFIQFWPIRTLESEVSAVLGIIGAPAGDTTAFPLVSAAQKWRQELMWLRNEIARHFDEKSLVGGCPAMLRIFEQLRLARLSSVPVFLKGEAGTGKERLARVIHSASRFQRRAFVTLDGQLTPVVEWKRVLKQVVHLTAAPADAEELQPGTLYLSRIDAIPGDVQERLLDVVRAGDAGRHVRLIASASNALEPLLASGRFSAELLLRLSPLLLELPPLRERGDDIALLAQLFLEDANRDSERQVTSFDADVWVQLRRYQWPGNLDELQKVLQEAHVAAADGVIRSADLPFRFRAGVDAQQLGPARRRTRPLDAFLEQVEREELSRALREAGGNVTLAAELLQIPRARLYRRLDQLGLRQTEAGGERLDSPAESGEA